MRNPFKQPALSPLALATRDALQLLRTAGATRMVLMVGDETKVSIAALGVEGGPEGLARFVALHLPRAKDFIHRGTMRSLHVVPGDKKP